MAGKEETMEFKQLEYILAIYQYGSISKAAKKLYLSQPNLTKSLKNVEDEYNITLFTRTSKGMKLTKEGERFLNYTKDIIQRKEMLDNVFKKWQIQNLNIVKLASQHFSFLSVLVDQLYQKLNNQQYKIYINECGRGRVIESILNHNENIGILVMSNQDPKVFKQYVSSLPLEFTRLAYSSIYCCVGKKNPLYYKEKLSFEDVKNQTMIIFDTDQMTQQGESLEGELDNFDSSHMIITDSLFLSLQLLENDDTALLTTRWTIDFIINENIRAIPIENSKQVNHLYWIKHQNHQLDENEKFIIKTLEELQKSTV